MKDRNSEMQNSQLKRTGKMVFSFKKQWQVSQVRHGREIDVLVICYQLRKYVSQKGVEGERWSRLVNKNVSVASTRFMRPSWPYHWTPYLS